MIICQLKSDFLALFPFFLALNPRASVVDVGVLVDEKI